jgi:hypothetical protein
MYAQLSPYAPGSDKGKAAILMPTVLHYKVDVERSAGRIFNTPELWSAWCSVVRRHCGLPDRDPIPGDLERGITLAAGKEWERLGLDKPHDYFAGTASYFHSTVALDMVSNLRGGKARHGHCRRGRVSPEYMAWQNMKARCKYAYYRGYENYGGRGIGIAPKFLVFEEFLAEVGYRPSPQHSLDRIDNDGYYAPGNVRWVLRSDQNKNRRPASEWPSTKRKAAAKAATRPATPLTRSEQLAFDFMNADNVAEEDCADIQHRAVQVTGEDASI